jgi:hypothetical protein
MHFRVLLTASCALLVTHAVSVLAFAQDVAASKPASIAIASRMSLPRTMTCPLCGRERSRDNIHRTYALSS